VLNKQPERLKTLHTLTGGNPRVLTLIYRLLEAGQSEEAMADLEILLDQVTPYYKARIEEYQSAQQRAVIDAISLHWDPITTGDLARVTNISTTTLSPLLIKLRKDGLIENVETSGPYAGHQLVERFFNIWYLMRHGTRRTKQKMRWLVAFLTSFYSSRELAEIARRANDKGIRKSWHPDFLSAFDEALACQGQSFMENDQPHVFISTNSAPSKLESAIAQNDATSSDDRLLKAGRLIQNASKFFEAKNWINCKKALDELLTCFADSREPALRELVAGALVDKAITLRMMDDNEAAISTYDETLARFADANEPELRNQVARALANKANTLGQMGDNTAAIAAYDEILTRFADADELELRKRVARALVSKAQMLGQMRENGGAIAACDDVFARFADSNEQELRTQVARALVSKAITLRQMGDRVGAIAACDEVLARFADAIEPDVRRQVARAFVSKAITLRAMGDDRAAIAACDEVIARFADVNEPELRTQVARAYVSKAITFRKIDDNAAAITVCDEVISRFAGTNEAGLREQVARALENKIIALRQMDNNAAVLTICDESFARFGNASEPELQKHVARTLVIKAVTLGAMGDNVGAIAAYDKVLERLADVNELELREQVVSALVNKAVTLGEMGDSAAAVAICNEVYARFARSSELELLVWVARALFQKAATFAKIGDSSAAILAFEQALDFDDQKPKTLPATLIAGARIVLANILLDSREEMSRAETLYLEAASVIPLPANANLVWLYLLASRVLDAIHLKSSLEELPAHGRALIDAGIELINDNFGFATGYLEAALGGGLETGNMDFTDDLDRLLRIAGSKGYGERLIAWFEKTGFAERIAPIYVAFKAFVRTENILLDVNPEVRGPAKIIYDRLDAPRRYRIEIAPKKAQAKRRRVAAREAQK